MANEYWLLSNLSLSTGTNQLTWNPHPVEFQAYSEVKIGGDGVGTGTGLFRMKWSSGDGILSSAQWNYLMSMFSGWEPSTDVYIRTRTDLIITDVYAEGGYMYDYRWFSAKMWRPRGEPRSGFRYGNVEILFTGGELI